MNFLIMVYLFLNMILSSASSLPYIPKKIVSLVPSQTELLHHLQLDTAVTGITKFCVHPSSWFKTKTRIGGTKSIDIPKIIALNPDLIIANKEENLQDEVEALAVHFPVWVTDVKDLHGSLQMILDVGELIGKSEEALELTKKIRQAFMAWESRLQQMPRLHLNAAYLIWKDPYMSAGGDTFIHDMMMHAGFNNMFAASARYPTTSVQELQAGNCDVLLLASEPYPFSMKHAEALRAVLPGVKILLADGEIFSWYGSRLLQAPAYFEELHNRLLNQNFT